MCLACFGKASWAGVIEESQDIIEQLQDAVANSTINKRSYERLAKTHSLCPGVKRLKTLVSTQQKCDDGELVTKLTATKATNKRETDALQTKLTKSEQNLEVARAQLTAANAELTTLKGSGALKPNPLPVQSSTSSSSATPEGALSVDNFCKITAAMGTFGEGAVKAAAALNTGSAGTAGTSMVVTLAKLLGSGGRETGQQSTDSISFEILKKLQGCGMLGKSG